MSQSNDNVRHVCTEHSGVQVRLRWLFVSFLVFVVSGCSLRHVQFTGESSSGGDNERVVTMYMDYLGDIYPPRADGGTYPTNTKNRRYHCVRRY
jgi:hypothetical protein